MVFGVPILRHFRVALMYLKSVSSASYASRFQPGPHQKSRMGWGRRGNNVVVSYQLSC